MGKLLWSFILVVLVAFVWHKMSIPQLDHFDQTGRRFLVTGANTGIGFTTATALASMGADVTVTCRSKAKCEPILQTMREINAQGSFDSLVMDLGDFESVREAAGQFLESGKSLNVLINNAGVLGPKGKTTKDGFGVEMGVNHYGTFLFTNLLLPRLLQDRTNRIVVVASKTSEMNVKINRTEPRGLPIDPPAITRSF